MCLTLRVELLQMIAYKSNVTFNQIKCYNDKPTYDLTYTGASRL